LALALPQALAVVLALVQAQMLAQRAALLIENSAIGPDVNSKTSNEPSLEVRAVART